MRFSLRDLLLAVAFFAVACAALKFAGGVWWSILSAAALLLFMAAAVVAFVGREEQRAFAIGFTVCAVIYGALLFLAGANELDPYGGRLPTSKILWPLFRAMVTGKYVDMQTGQEMPDYKPPQATGNNFFVLGGGMGGGMGGMGGGGILASMPTYIESVDRTQFMSIGHLLWGLLLGVVGGRFAAFVYARNRKEGSPPTPAAPG